MYKKPARYEGIPDSEFVRLPVGATLRALLEALDSAEHWSGAVVETARFVYALDEYVRCAVLDARYGPCGPDEAIRVTGCANDCSLALTAQMIDTYRNVEQRLPRDKVELAMLDDSLAVDFTQSARAFVHGIARASPRLLPLWVPTEWSDDRAKSA